MADTRAGRKRAGRSSAVSSRVATLRDWTCSGVRPLAALSCRTQSESTLNRPHPIRFGQRVLSALARRALLRYVRRPAAGGGTSDGIVILLSSAWGMGGTIRSVLNLAGWLGQHRDVKIITPYRRRDEPFFGAFPPGVVVTALADERTGCEPRGLAGIAYRGLHRVPSVLFPKTDRLRKDHSLWRTSGWRRCYAADAGSSLGHGRASTSWSPRCVLPALRRSGWSRCISAITGSVSGAQSRAGIRSSTRSSR